MRAASRVADPLLASMFIAGGLDAVQHPEGKVKKAEFVTKPVAARVGILPDDTETLVKINGAVQIAAGSLLALGKFRRLAALALIGSVIPTTAAGHRFWEEVDPEQQAQQRVHFLKNAGLLGGLVLAATESSGKANRAAGRATGTAKEKARQTKKRAKDVKAVATSPLAGAFSPVAQGIGALIHR